MTLRPSRFNFRSARTDRTNRKARFGRETLTTFLLLLLCLASLEAVEVETGAGEPRIAENETAAESEPPQENTVPPAGATPRLVIKDFDEDALFTDEELAAARQRLTRRQLGTELFYAFMFRQTERINTLLTELYRIAPESEDFNYYAALREFRTGQRGRAIAYLKKAVKINPAYDPAWNLIGLIYTRADRHKDAREAFQKAVDAAPYEPAYTYNLATALVKEGRPKDALAFTKKSIELKGNSADAYHLQARVLRDLERYDEALDAFAKANFYGVASNDFMLDWLRTAHRAENTKQALELCERIGGGHPEVLRIHADIRLKHAEFARAIPLLRALVAGAHSQPEDRRRYIYAVHKARQNPRAALRGLRVGAQERRDLAAYIKDLREQRREAPVVRDPILSPPQ